MSSSNVLGRAVTIPETVRHFIIPVAEGSSLGKILTTACTVIQSLGPTQRMLLLLTRNFDITTQNAIGALKHFQCLPEPISLLNALETTTEGTEAIMQLHRQVTGVRGVGGTAENETDDEAQPRGYSLVTGEDSIRGLHLDGLDVVLVAARSVGLTLPWSLLCIQRFCDDVLLYLTTIIYMLLVYNNDCCYSTFPCNQEASTTSICHDGCEKMRYDVLLRLKKSEEV